MDSITILNPYQSPGIFRKAQLHLHTSESLDVWKRIPVEQTVRRYKEAGYHFIVITDHDRVTQFEALNDSEFVVIPGIEETIVAGVWPLGKHLLRINPTNKASRENQPEFLNSESNDLIIPAHLNWPGNFWTGRWRLSELRCIPNLRLLEIYNRHSSCEKDVRLWHQLLVERDYGRPIWGIAVDDTDNGTPLDLGWVMVKIPEISQQALMAALRHGAFYATCGPKADFGVTDGSIYAKTPEEASIRFINSSFQIFMEVQGTTASYQPKISDQFVRIEIINKQGKTAWSQPFFIVA